MPRPRKAPVRAKRVRARPSRGMLLSPIIGACAIVTIAWGVSLLQASPEIVAAGALTYAVAEGIVLALIGSLWSRRGVGVAVAVAVLTALLAVPGRWLLAYQEAGRPAPLLDLVEDLGATIAWAAFAGFASATILRDRLSALIPNRHVP